MHTMVKHANPSSPQIYVVAIVLEQEISAIIAWNLRTHVVEGSHQFHSFVNRAIMIAHFSWQRLNKNTKS